MKDSNESMAKDGPATNFLQEPVPGENTIPPQDEIDRLTPEQAAQVVGCWWEGHQGHYIGKYVVEEALGRGWHAEDESTIREMVEVYPNLTNDQYVIWDEVVNDAEQWLNDAVAPEGYSFGWHDGEFFFQPDYWWCEGEEGGYCDDPDHPHFERAAENMARYRDANFG